MSDSGLRRVFVLGAGFSAAEEFPLVRGLRDRVLHFIEAERHSAYRVFLQPGNGDFARGQFYAGLDRIDPDGKLEFEELLIALSDHLRSASDHDPCHITSKVLRVGCARFLWCLQNSIWRVSAAYQNFAAHLNGGSDAIISFNWDVLTERALHESGVAWAYNPTSAGIPIIKPHGSINWSGHLRQNLRAEYGGWRSLGPGSRLSFDSETPLSNPDMQETNSDLRYMLYPGDPELPDEDADVQWLWEQADAVTGRCDTITFIGYSLPDYDSFASRFFARFDAKKIEVFTPSDDHLQRYARLFPQAELNAQKFEHCRYSRPIA